MRRREVRAKRASNFRKLLFVTLAILATTIGASSVAKAVAVEVGYTISTTFGVPALGVPTIGPPGAGTAIIRYTAPTLTSAAYSLVGGPSFFALPGPAKIVGGTFAGPISFTVAGDIITGFGAGALGLGPGGFTFGPGGTLALALSGGVSGTAHCTGATCTAIGFTASAVGPIGFAATGVFSGFAGLPGGGTLPTFTLAGIAGTLGGFVVTGSIVFTEAPLFGGASRHLVPEPGTAMLVGLGLVGLAAARRARRH